MAEEGCAFRVLLSNYYQKKFSNLKKQYFQLSKKLFPLHDFSDTFLVLFNQTLTYQTKDYLNLTMSLENYILSLSTMINSIDSIDRIDRGNENLENLLTNLNVDFYQKLGVGG